MILSNRKPVARKQHECDVCGAVIKPRERYHLTAGIWDDGFYTWKACGPCADLLPVVAEVADDPYSVSDEDYRYWAETRSDDAEHGEAARALLARMTASRDAWIARMNAAHGEGLW